MDRTVGTEWTAAGESPTVVHQNGPQERSHPAAQFCILCDAEWAEAEAIAGAQAARERYWRSDANVLVGSSRRRTAAELGYGMPHRTARRHLARTLPAPCGYCEKVISRDDLWHAAHRVDGDPSSGWVVAHPLCNQRAKRKQETPEPDWVHAPTRADVPLTEIQHRRLVLLINGTPFAAIAEAEGVGLLSIQQSLVRAVVRRGVVDFKWRWAEKPPTMRYPDLRYAAMRALEPEAVAALARARWVPSN